jgi:hypothetical protein
MRCVGSGVPVSASRQLASTVRRFGGRKNEPAAVAAAGSWTDAIRLLAGGPMNLRDQLTGTRGRGGGVIAGIGRSS